MKQLPIYLNETLFGAEDPNFEKIDNDIVMTEFKKYTYHPDDFLKEYSVWEKGNITCKNGKIEIDAPIGSILYIDGLDHTPNFSISRIVHPTNIYLRNCKIKNLEGLFAPGCVMNTKNARNWPVLIEIQDSELVSLSGLENLKFTDSKYVGYHFINCPNLIDINYLPKTINTLTIDKCPKLIKSNKFEITNLPKKIIKKFFWAENGKFLSDVCKDAGCGSKIYDLLDAKITNYTYKQTTLTGDEWDYIMKNFRN